MCDGEFKISEWSFAVYLCKKGVNNGNIGKIFKFKLQVNFQRKFIGIETPKHVQIDVGMV